MQKTNYEVWKTVNANGQGWAVFSKDDGTHTNFETQISAQQACDQLNSVSYSEKEKLALEGSIASEYVWIF